MIRLAGSIVLFLSLFALQVSFIHALPYPFDRIPLVLVVTIYLYQYERYGSVVWWFVGFGALIDVLDISMVPLEVLSYMAATITLLVTARQVFTNKSFYSMAAIALLCTLTIAIAHSLLLFVDHLVHGTPVFWELLWNAQLWSAVFAVVIFLFIISPLRQLTERSKQALLRRI